MTGPHEDLAVERDVATHVAMVTIRRPPNSLFYAALIRARARLSANFAQLGFHHGFGLTVPLPRVVGEQRAAELLYTGDRFVAATEHDMVEQAWLRQTADFREGTAAAAERRPPRFVGR